MPEQEPESLDDWEAKIRLVILDMVEAQDWLRLERIRDIINAELEEAQLRGWR